MRLRLTYANVMATVAVFIALGGASYAAFKVPKNSVGTRQLKKSSVTTAKIKKNAVNGAKVKANSLTGSDINLNKLGTVPSAEVANGLAAAEAWHEVGGPGQPSFEDNWENVKISVGAFPESVAFYRDQGGVVHLRGEAVAGIDTGSSIFRLPPGYRPANGRSVTEPVACEGLGCPNGVGSISILGSNQKPGEPEGGVLSAIGATHVYFDGITFRAES